jgi:hypothetical protein
MFKNIPQQEEVWETILNELKGMKHTYPHAKPEMKKFNVSYNRGYKGVSLGAAVS